ncbi:MAG: hypothetical protein CJBNEKGG_01016 [Prosthecobacter sp.]|nr:hypothetical protein [Prosthecobacter sp.]
MFRRILQTGGWLALALGLVLQLWLKDRHMVLALVFYALPKPCLAGLALLLFRLGRGWRRMMAATAFVMISGWWIAASWSSGNVAVSAPARIDANKTAEEVTILYWNLCRPRGLDRQAVELVESLKPDIAAFVEPGPNVGELLDEYEQLLPGYRASWMPRGILWLSRLPSRHRVRGKLDDMGAFARFEVNLPGGAFPMVVADVHPGLWRPRLHQLDEVLQHSLGRADAVLAGDFNTPLESVFFEPYRARLTNVLEAAGRGFRETWPCGLPLLSLDQVWAGADWQVLEARKIWRLTGSDHAALYVRLRRR